MHVAFDISQTGKGKAGCGYYAHALIQSLIEITPRNLYSLLPSFGDFYFDPSMPLLSPYLGRRLRYGPKHLSYSASKNFWNHPDVEVLLKRPDIVHSNNFWCPTQLSSSRLIYTLYDLGFAFNPNWTSETNRVGCFDGVFRASIKSDWIVAISEFSRSHYLNLFPHFPQSRIRVIYPCSRFTDIKLKGIRPKDAEMLLSENFWLSVGTIEPRKNYDKLIHAYARYLSLGGNPIPLVIAGGNGWLMNDFVHRIDDLGLKNHIKILGYVSDENLIWLYSNCYANLYPSLFEGFGLPVLEGMQFGSPVLASNSSSIPEVAGDAAILLPPESIEDWAQAMLKLAKNTAMRARLSDASMAQSKNFSWRKSAESLLNLYEEAIATPKKCLPE